MSGRMGRCPPPPAAGVFAAQHAIVMPLLRSSAAARGSHRVERMRPAQYAEDLEDAVERGPASSYSFACTRNAFQVHLRHVAAPRELEVHAQRRVGSGHASSPARSEESSLLRNHSSRRAGSHDGDAARKGKRAQAHVEMSTRIVWYSDARSSRARARGPARPHLIVVEQLQGAGVDHDEGRSMPNAPALANGVCDTNSSGRSANPWTEYVAVELVSSAGTGSARRAPHPPGRQPHTPLPMKP